MKILFTIVLYICYVWAAIKGCGAKDYTQAAMFCGISAGCLTGAILLWVV